MVKIQEKRRELPEGEELTCPKCNGDDLENLYEHWKCNACGLIFRVQQVIVWNA